MTYSSPLAGDERRSVPDFLPEKLAKIQVQKCQRVYGYGGRLSKRGTWARSLPCFARHREVGCARHLLRASLRHILTFNQL